jgi:hypothetical protein
MKMKIFSLLCAVGVLFTMNSCKKEYLVDVTGTISGNVKEATTYDYVSKVLVSIIVDKNTILKDSTDENGNYSISGVPVGEHAIVFSKEGYGTMRSYVNVYPSDQVANTTNGKKQSYSVGKVCNPLMYLLSGKAKGTVTLNDAPQSGITVTAYFTYYYDDVNYSYVCLEPSYATTTTDANGAYSFSNLPVGANISFVASNSTASGSESATISSFVVPEIVDNIDMSEEALRLISYTGQGSNVYVDSTGTIKLVFSEAVSQSVTEAHGGSISLYNYYTDETVLVEASYSQNEITIKPAGSASLTPGGYYYIQFDVYASDTKNISSSYSYGFIVKSLAGTVTVPTMSYDATNGLRIATLSSGTNLSGNVTYYLWRKAKGAFDYNYWGSYSASTAPHPLIASPTSGDSFILVAEATGKNGVKIYSRSTEVTIP